MGVMYAMKCDLCGVVQVKDRPSDIQGTTYNENNVMKFACTQCRSLMKAAFEIKKKGLRDPLSKVAGLIEQRDKAKRVSEEAMAVLEGTNPFAALAVGDPKAVLKMGPQPGQAIPLVNKPPGIGHETSRKKGHGKKT